MALFPLTPVRQLVPKKTKRALVDLELKYNPRKKEAVVILQDLKVKCLINNRGVLYSILSERSVDGDNTHNLNSWKLSCIVKSYRYKLIKDSAFRLWTHAEKVYKQEKKRKTNEA